ncbi:MAG: hypothetical protein LUI15_04125 [Firmicutes bacterium]|nr:hypothetical protein [Bacillota bacterium]
MSEGTAKVRTSDFLRVIKKSIGIIAASTESDGLWISENKLKLSYIGREIVKSLSSEKTFPAKDGEMQILSVCESYLSAAKGELTESGLISALNLYQSSNDYLTISELCHVRDVLSGLLLCRIAECMLSENDKNKHIGEYIKHIYELSDIDFAAVTSSVSYSESILIADPAGIYVKCDSETKALYRQCLEKIAKRDKMSEYEAALMVKERAENSVGVERHIGYYLMRMTKMRAPWLWFALLSVIPAAASAVLAAFSFALGNVPAFFASLSSFFPLRKLTSAVYSDVVKRLGRPSVLPRLEINDIPPEGKTLAVFTAVLSGGESDKKLFDKLENYAVAYGSANLLFSVLADLPDCKSRICERDAEIINYAKSRINAINKKCGGAALFSREREYSNTERKYMGRERKRGAQGELFSLLSGGASSLEVYGEVDLSGVNYVLALDTDTQILFDDIKKLIGTALHPCCSPVISSERGYPVVISGYGVIQPKISVSLEHIDEADRYTTYRYAFSGAGSYSAAEFSLYASLFETGVFCGKGLISVNAYSRCVLGAFPREKILSHDIAEGLRLRCGFASDAEIYDSVPSGFLSERKRAHRWMRGDLQSSILSSRYIRDENNRKYRNPITLRSKMILTEPIYEMITSSLRVPAILLSLYSGGGLGFIVTMTLISDGIYAFLKRIVGAANVPPRKYLSGLPDYYAASLFDTFFPCIRAADECCLSADALYRTFFRMKISKRRLLEWTTAAAADGEDISKFFVYAKRLCGSFVIGVAAVLLSFMSSFPFAVISAALGISWFCFPLMIYKLSRKKDDEKVSPTKGERDGILRDAHSMWRFFDEYVTEKNNFLPPDNVSFLPLFEEAERTSPTNIGMYLLSTLNAHDFGFITSGELKNRLEKSLSSIESLEKFHGHLYNWYDIKNLRVLYPSYVSTVDSGNFVCALLTVKNGIDALGDEFKSLSVRMERIISETDFSVLYSRRRGLYHIGYNGITGEFDKNVYDFYSSEMLTTSFYTTAAGIVPGVHLSCLGRLYDDSLGIPVTLSWSGSAFEYFMPCIFLPFEKKSERGESLLAASAIQSEHRALFENTEIFGKSESGFYDFDAEMNYSYKAFGCEELALSKNIRGERVFAPYSLYLLTAVSDSPYKLLDSLRKTSLYGKYGFYEALDITPSRVGDGYGIVRQYMSHHIGMSITSAANAYFNGINRMRFMQTPVCSAASPLLYKKAEISKKKLTREILAAKTKPLVYPDGDLSVKTDFAVISNGRIKAAVSSDGDIAVYDGKMLIPQPIMRGCDSFHILLKLENEVYDLIRDGDGTKMRRSFLYDGCSVCFSAESFYGDIYFSAETSIFCDSTSPTVHVSVKIHGDVPDGTIVFMFSPVLNTESTYLASPSYSDLFFTAARDGNTVMFKKTSPEGKEGKTSFLLVSVRKGCETGENLTKFYLRKDEILPFAYSSADIYKIFNLRKDCDYLDKSEEALIQTVFAAAIPSGEGAELLLSTEKTPSFGDFKSRLDGAKNTARLFRTLSGADESAVKRAFDIAKCVLCRVCRVTEFADINDVTASQDLFWRYGISGDLPLYTVFFKKNADENDASVTSLTEFIRAKRFLFISGVRFDLVVIADDVSYISSDASFVREHIADNGCENLLGHGGGIHIVDSGTLSPGDEAAFIARSCGFFDISFSHSFEIKRPDKDVETLKRHADVNADGEKITVGSGRVDIINGAYPSPMTMMYSGGVFGTLLTNKTLGFSWYFNSSESRITARHVDPLLGTAGEVLTLYINGVLYDAAACADNVCFSFERAVYCGMIDGVRYKMSVGIADRLPTKLYLIEFDGGADIKAELTLYLPRNAAIKDGVITLLGGERVSMSLFEISDGVTGRTVCRGDSVSILSTPYHGVCGFALSAAAGKNADDCFDKIKRTFVSTVDIELSLKRAGKRLTDLLLAGNARYGGAVGEMFDFAAYQAMVYRIFGRCGYSQPGGAYGYRDQLQDSLSAVWFAPRLTREMIFRSCANQYDDGSARHWYHPYVGGLKTKCSDDFMWLPYVTAEYILMTGEYDILEKETAFCISPALSPGETDRYENPHITETKHTVYEHCMRAIEHSLKRGEHMLPLIVSGDWNDGMNRIGVRGRGESVWLAFFFAIAYRKFAEALDFAGYDREICERLENEADKLIAAADNAWDGDRYIRAYDDNGAVIGGHSSPECKIDILPQAFSVFANGDSEKSNIAMDSVIRELYDEEKGIMRLFAPPYDRIKSCGYICSYPPGVRENGGQYTHAAIWAAAALFRLGRRDEGMRVLLSLTPLSIYENGRINGNFTAEPYLLCADIAYGDGITGKSGWSGYTGSASWWYITVMRYLFGAEMSLGMLRVTPPESTPSEYSFAVRLGSDVVKIKVSESEKCDGEFEYDRVYEAKRGETVLIPPKKNLRNVLIKIKK